MNDGPVTTWHVQRAIRGDQESLAWVVAHFSPILRAQASWRLGARLRGQVDPDDVVSDAWLVVLRRLPDLDRDGGRTTPRLLAFVGTTILRIVNRRIDQAIRLGRTTPQAPAKDEEGADALAGLEATVTGAVTNAARNELARALAACLAELADKDREVILLRVAEGLSNDEVARELGEAPNTVSHRYRRALEKLRKAVPESLFDEVDDE
jgi:RNA polymerase sigma-70 factor (ECF subfamily)